MADTEQQIDWQNWAGNVRAHQISVRSPQTLDEILEVVAEARASGQRVRPIGSGHSFTAIGEPVDLQVRLDRWSGIVSHDPDSMRVRVRAGTPLYQLNPALEQLGLALPNLGDIDRQTVAGAISTGTHGTGLRFTGLAGFVTAVQVVRGDGSVEEFGEAHRPEMVPAVSVGLGALGLVTEYELQCVPAFLLRAEETPGRLADVLADLGERIETADHFEFYWFPHTDLVQTKVNTRIELPAPRHPVPRWRELLDDRLLSNVVFEGINRLTTAVPQAIPRVNQVSGRALSARTYTDVSHRVFASRRDVRFRESEFAVPREQVPALLAELKGYLDRQEETVAFPVEVRFTAADDRWLSTAYERETGYIAVHQYHRREHARYFETFWSMVRQVPGARPHWGKLHDFTAADLDLAYPRIGEFRSLRNEFDPDRLFSNPHLESLLGP